MKGSYFFTYLEDFKTTLYIFLQAIRDLDLIRTDINVRYQMELKKISIVNERPVEQRALLLQNVCVFNYPLLPLYTQFFKDSYPYPFLQENLGPSIQVR